MHRRAGRRRDRPRSQPAREGLRLLRLALDRVAEARAAHVPPGALAHRIALREAEARLARDDVAGARAALANVPREGGPEPTWRACLAASLGEAPADVADLRAALAAHPSAAERARAARCGR